MQRLSLTKTLLTLTTACFTLGLCLTPPARADLEGNLRYMPPHPDAFFTLNTDYQNWKYFLERPPFSEQLDRFLEIWGADLKAKMGLDLKTELLPLIGSYVSLGMYRAEWTQNENLPVLLAMDVKDTKAYQKLVQQLTRTAAQDPHKYLQHKNYRKVDLYGFTRQEGDTGALYMGLSGHTLIMGSESMLKTALDLNAHPEHSLGSNPQFKIVQSSLQDQKLWLYLNPQSLSSFVHRLPTHKGLNTEAIQQVEQVQDAYQLYDALGLGLNLSSNGLMLKAAAHFRSSGLSPTQAAYVKNLKAVWNRSDHPLRALLQGSSRRPLLFLGLDGLRLLNQSFDLFSPKDPQTRAALQHLDQNWTRLTGLKLNQDLLNNSDGRMALVVFYPEGTQHFDHPPDVLLLAGVRDNAKMLKALTEHFAFDLSGLSAGQKGEHSPQPIRFEKKPQSYYDGHPIYLVQKHPLIDKLRRSIYFEPAFSMQDKLWLFASSPETLKQGLDYLQGREANLQGNVYFNRMLNLQGIEDRGALIFMDLTQLLRMLEFLAGGDEEVGIIKPTLSAFHSLIAGGHYSGDLAEGYLILDVDMDRVDFKLISELLRGSTHKEVQNLNLKPATPSRTPANTAE